MLTLFIVSLIAVVLGCVVLAAYSLIDKIKIPDWVATIAAIIAVIASIPMWIGFLGAVADYVMKGG